MAAQAGRRRVERAGGRRPWDRGAPPAEWVRRVGARPETTLDVAGPGAPKLVDIFCITVPSNGKNESSFKFPT